ncbi:MAG: c-type cytochrome [Pseudomonadota bacterium]
MPAFNPPSDALLAALLRRPQMIQLARDVKRTIGLLVSALCLLATAQMSHTAQATERANGAKKQGSANLEGHGGPVKAIAVDHTSGRILTGSFDYAMMLWQLSEDGSAKQLKRFDDHDGAVSAVSFVPGAKQVLSGSDDGALHLWDIDSGKRLQLMKGHGAKILGLDVSSDGMRAVTASWDRTVRIWDLQTGKAIHILKGHTAPINAAIFTADNKQILSAATDGTLRLWNAEPGTLQRVAYRHGWGINVLKRLADTDQFLFGALDGSTGIYDLSNNKLVHKLKAHEKPVLSIAALRKPGLIATGGGGGEIRIYRQGDWRLLETYRNPYGPIWAMDFADRGTRVYYGSLDDHATAWQVSPRKPFEKVASNFPRRFQVKRNISLGERQFARKCSICHTLHPDDANRAGPTLHNVFGRKIGTLPGYPYSKALKSLDIVWSADTIDKLFALGPDKFTPGSKMPLQRIAEKEKRDALVNFLKEATKVAKPDKTKE